MDQAFLHACGTEISLSMGIKRMEATPVLSAKRMAIRRLRDSRSKRWEIARPLSMGKGKAVDIGYMNHKDACVGCPCFHRMMFALNDIFYQRHQ